MAAGHPIEIFYQSLNPEPSSTVVLIHGAITNSKDWNLVVPHLNDYHLLLPDSTGHGCSANLSFSVDNAATHIANLIASAAKQGKAHIVGHSLGAKVAIRLAEKYPDAVLTCLVSGYEVFPNLNSAATPYLFWAINKFNDAIPRPIVRWAMDGADIGRTSDVPFKLYREISEVGSSSWPESWPARTLMIAAGKGDWLVPSADHPEDARKLAEIGREGNAETRAVTHLGMRHPWNRQAPELFARVVRAWVEGKELPEGFVGL
jgi:pimeloyl-ACP methyl ester carboxylesterase